MHFVNGLENEIIDFEISLDGDIYLKELKSKYKHFDIIEYMDNNKRWM